MVKRKMVRNIAFKGHDTKEVSQGHQGTRNRSFNVTSQLVHLLVLLNAIRRHASYRPVISLKGKKTV